MDLSVKHWCVFIAFQSLAVQPLFAVESFPTFTPKKIISGGYHTCLLSTSGQVKCWGSNRDGSLGLGSTKEVGNVPYSMGASLQSVDLGENVVVKDMCAGFNYSCAMSTTGRIKCWGLNYLGELGQESGKRSVGSEPNQMGDRLPWTNLGSDFVAADVQCGHEFACATNTKGQVKCWGSNYHGELGRKTADRKDIGSQPGDMGDNLPYQTLPPVKSLSLGLDYACAATSEAVYCWGYNSGVAGIESRVTPVYLPADAKDALKVKLEDEGIATVILGITSGDGHNCAEYTIGTPAKKKIKCWGGNSDGQLGIGSNESVGAEPGTMGSKLPELQLDFSDVIQIESYASVSCALKRNGAVQCWGRNDDGQLGLGDKKSRGSKPGDLGPNLKYVDLALPALSLSRGSSSRHVCAVLINHEVKCWGHGDNGQLGNEDAVSRGGKPNDMGDNLPFVHYR